MNILNALGFGILAWILSLLIFNTIVEDYGASLFFSIMVALAVFLITL